MIFAGLLLLVGTTTASAQRTPPDAQRPQPTIAPLNGPAQNPGVPYDNLYGPNLPSHPVYNPAFKDGAVAANAYPVNPPQTTYTSQESSAPAGPLPALPPVANIHQAPGDTSPLLAAPAFPDLVSRPQKEEVAAQYIQSNSVSGDTPYADGQWDSSGNAQPPKPSAVDNSNFQFLQPIPDPDDQPQPNVQQAYAPPASQLPPNALSYGFPANGPPAQAAAAAAAEPAWANVASSPPAVPVNSPSTTPVNRPAARPMKTPKSKKPVQADPAPTFVRLQEEYFPIPKDPRCSDIYNRVMSDSAKRQVGQYCSSRMNLKGRPTVTATVTTTATETETSTYTTRTTTITQYAKYIPDDVSLELYVVTKTLRGTTSTTLSTTLFPTQYYSCLGDTRGRRMLESQGQAANTFVPKPTVFNGLADHRAETSACGCLGLSTDLTSTVTSAFTSRSIVYSSQNEVATTTSYVLPPGMDFSIRIPPTSTRLINSKTTITYTQGTATSTAFALVGSNNKYARVSDGKMLHFSTNYTSPSSHVPTIFRLDVETCALSIVDGVDFGMESFVAMEATNPGHSLGADTVRFEHPDEARAGLTALLCHIDESSQHLLCSVDGDSPNGGTMRDSEYWRLGSKLSENFAIKAMPVDHSKACLAQCRQQDNMLFLDGDQFVGQIVLQSCLAKCKKGSKAFKG